MKSNQIKIIPVILSGGSGTRLWPLSRSKLPKQFLPSLYGKVSMFQKTISRLSGLEGITDPIIVCNDEHKFLVTQQLQELNIFESTIILEPVARNTAPAITAATISSLQDKQNNSQEILLLVLPSDHVIQDLDEFHKSIERAKIRALKNNIVTFGIVPTEPYTGYGYIEVEEKGAKVSAVKSFLEKPKQEKANKLFSEGKHLWNSGMFMFKPELLISELEIHSKPILDATRRSLEKSTQDQNFIHLEKESFSSSPSISFDFALMEKIEKSEVVALEASWSDLGTWSALYDVSPKDMNQNVLKGDILAEDTSNSFIRSENRTIAALGLEDIVIIDTADSILVSKKSQSHEVGRIVSELKNQNKESVHLHRKVYRPWGWYESIERGDTFQVKRISVNPGSKLSLQSHKFRSEHWIVVKGTAKVTCESQEFSLQENESTYIPLGAKHRLENSTNESVEIIEIQIGSYLGEDDIKRYDDDYGRS